MHTMAAGDFMSQVPLFNATSQFFKKIPRLGDAIGN